jgi:dolichol-phosphate mannosyltransferase
LERVHKALEGVNYEVIIVDDDSPDGTWVVAERFSHKFGNIKVVRRLRKMGLASAFLEGLANAEGAFIGLMDADLQHSPELLHIMLDTVRAGADLAIASRYVHGGRVERLPLHRRVISRGATALAHLLFPRIKAVKDPMSGFFIFKREVIDGVKLSARSFKMLLEILTKGDYNRVAEIPYTFRSRKHGRSKLSSKELWNYLKHLYRLVKDTEEHLRFLKFCTVGLSGIAVSEGALWFFTEITNLLYLVSAVLSSELVVINNFIWNDVWTFRDRVSDPSIKAALRRFLRFNLTRIGGIAIGLAVLAILTEAFGIHYLISNLFAVCVAVLWNYFMSTHLVWESQIKG